jgi:hypothetical protein
MVLGLTGIGLYALAAIIAVLTTAVASLFSIQPWVEGASSACTLLSAMAFLAEGALLIPLC